MKTICEGCGSKIQTTEPLKAGFIDSEVYLKNPDNFYCQRCYSLIHYNKNIPIEIDDEVFVDNIKKINKTNSLIVNVVDIYDLEGTIVRNINQLFPNKDILLVANKFDLFLDSVKIIKVKEYLENFLKENKIKVIDFIIISSFQKSGIKTLIQKLAKYQNKSDIYLFGYTNVGKSSILNKLTESLNIKNQKITVSNIKATTLDLIKIPFRNKTFIYDMPGIVNTSQLNYYLNDENQKLFSSKKYIKPRVYQLNPKQALFIGGVLKIMFLEGDKISVIVNVVEKIVVHRTKLENANDFYNKHKDDILKLPNLEERARLGEFKKYSYEFKEGLKEEIAVSGLGFITIIGNAKIEIEVFEKLNVRKRKAII